MKFALIATIITLVLARGGRRGGGKTVTKRSYKNASSSNKATTTRSRSSKKDEFAMFRKMTGPNCDFKSMEEIQSLSNAKS
jgi:hypothetical protein